jgi:hypothetical protein
LPSLNGIKIGRYKNSEGTTLAVEIIQKQAIVQKQATVRDERTQIKSKKTKNFYIASNR